MVSTRIPSSASSGAAAMNGSETTTAVGVDHLDDGGGLLGPAQQVGARGGLMQHGQAGAAHPDALRGRRDLDRGAGQHRYRVAMSDACGGQATRDVAGPLVHLGPGVPDRRVAARR